MPQLETAIVGKNNTKAGVTGQNELLVKINSADPGSGLATEATLQNVDTNIANILGNTDGVLRTAHMLRTTTSGNLSSVASEIYSVSVANVGSADGTVLGATLKAGEIVNFDASSLNHYFNSFAYNATGTEFIIIYVS
jgi:hypothetical protein